MYRKDESLNDRGKMQTDLSRLSEAKQRELGESVRIIRAHEEVEMIIILVLVENDVGRSREAVFNIIGIMRNCSGESSGPLVPDCRAWSAHPVTSSAPPKACR